jgi:hypothetical protein
MRSIFTAGLALAIVSLAAPAFAGPCAGGGWGAISDPNNSVHVAIGGDDGNSGTATSPLATLDEALDRSRTSGDDIAIHPGSFESDLRLDGADDGLVVAGCGADESKLVPPSGPEASLIDVDGTAGILLTGFLLDGGRSALKVHSGASLTADSVEISEALGAGLVVGGASTSVEFKDGEVRKTRVDSGSAAGVVLSGGALDLVLTKVSSNNGHGIEVLAGDLLLDKSSVRGTREIDDAQGEGLVASGGDIVMTNSNISDNDSDTAIDADEAKSVWMDGISVTVPTTGVDAILIPASSTVIDVTLNGQPWTL